jgi:hypothetical protein
MPQTIHWFKNIFLPFYLHGAIHAITVKLPVAAGFPQVKFGNMRGIYDVVATLDMLILPEVLDNTAYHCPLGMPVNQPRASLLVDAIKVKLCA